MEQKTKTKIVSQLSYHVIFERSIFREHEMSPLNDYMFEFGLVIFSLLLLLFMYPYQLNDIQYKC